MPPEPVFELCSPTSDIGIDLLKEDLLNNTNELGLPPKYAFPMALCIISDLEGSIKSSNARLDIDNAFSLFTSPSVKVAINETLLKCRHYSQTLLNGCIKEVYLQGHRLYVFIKVQQFCGGEKNTFLLWTLTKANIARFEPNDQLVFSIDGGNGKYTFLKLSFSFGLDSSLNLINFPTNLTQYLLGTDETPKHLSDLILHDLQVVEKVIESMPPTKQLSSMDSFDALPDAKNFHDEPLITCEVALKETLASFKLKIFPPVNYKRAKKVFPVSLSYENTSRSVHRTAKDKALGMLGNYEFQHLLSQSDYSIVYLAKDESGEMVVVKKALHSNEVEQTFYRYLQSSAETSRYIDPPIRVCDNENLLVFNYNPHCVDLFHYIENQRQLSDCIVHQIFAQVCEAIYFLHSRNIVHRDLKTENILIDESTLSIRLIDFGTTSFIPPNGSSIFNEYVGTFAYAPVEALKGQPYDAFKQDIWCLGIVLYVLAYSSFPFQNARESLQGFLRLPISRPSMLVSLLRQLLDPNPGKRPDIETVLRSSYVLNKN